MLRKTVRSSLVLLTLWTAFVTRVHANEPGEGQAFAPLAMFRINVSAQDQQDLVQIVEGFAQAHRFRIGGDIPLSSSLPLFGRRLVRREIDIIGMPDERNTFFRIENFRSEEIFELVAYSHESKEVWFAPWNELISLITARFGEANVKSVDLTPRPNRPDRPNHQDQVRQAFRAPPPVAFTKIRVQKGTRDDVLGLIHGFAILHHFGTEGVDFSIDGRLAIFRKIVIDADTFFVMDYSRDDSEIDLYGFSPKPDSVWGPRWRELTSKMQGAFSGPPY
jgi:hypothetical protein